MVVVVGVVLALVYMTLKPKQDLNIANDKRQQILSSVHIAAPDKDQVEPLYKKYITSEYIVNDKGEITSKGENEAFNIDMKSNIKNANRQLPVFECTLDDGSLKYIVPVYGAGLWGPIWGYIAVEADGQTIYGANFSHSSETPGLGAKIAEKDFQDEFNGLALYHNDKFSPVQVLKKGQTATDGAPAINAITGATITSRGVQTMLADCLVPYDAFFKKLKSETAK